jgi:hypothetical protein
MASVLPHRPGGVANSQTSSKSPTAPIKIHRKGRAYFMTNSCNRIISPDYRVFQKIRKRCDWRVFLKAVMRGSSSQDHALPDGVVRNESHAGKEALKRLLAHNWQSLPFAV